MFNFIELSYWPYSVIVTKGLNLVTYGILRTFNAQSTTTQIEDGKPVP